MNRRSSGKGVCACVCRTVQEERKSCVKALRQGLEDLCGYSVEGEVERWLMLWMVSNTGHAGWVCGASESS